MGFNCGIVGLPNVGKSTLFNALTATQAAESANYPFCTIEPNTGRVAVPDERLDKIAAIAKSAKVIHTQLEFVDIAGLVRGASKGEGLGNQFLGNIRETSAIVHVVRCFDDDNVVHVNAKPNPIDDIEVINTELLLADMQQLEKKIERLGKQVKGDRKLQPLLDCAESLKKHIDAGDPVATFSDCDSDIFAELNQELRFITAKTVIYTANVDEAGLGSDNPYVDQVKRYAESQGAECVKICAKLEEDMAGLSDDERQEFLTEAGATESGLAQVIQKGYRALGLISYFTAGPKEVRAWTIREGWTAPKAAGVIHTDFERGFIRAEVIGFDEYIRCGGEQEAKAKGLMRVEGKEYVVHDGDVMHFRFNV